MSNRSEDASLNQEVPEKSDEWLIQALRSDDPEDTYTAMAILEAQYRQRLRRSAASVLPADWVEDTVQNTWVSFYKVIKREKVHTSVSGLLKKIAKRRRVDAVRKLTREREIEQDLVPSESGWEPETAGIDDLLIAEEERQLIDDRLRLIRQFPLIDTVLSDCQRVVWVLSGVYDYAAPVVARLMGKQPNTIDKHISNARRNVYEFMKSREYQSEVDTQELPNLWPQPSMSPSTLIIERFAEEFTPNLTPDELAPVGLTSDDLRRGYAASLVMPRWHDPKLGVGTNLYMVLTRKPDWEEMQKTFKQLSRKPNKLPSIFPEECFLTVDVEDGHIVLDTAPLAQMIPETPDAMSTPDFYLSVHSPRVKLPILLAFFSQDVYTPDVLERWPFIDPATGI